MNNFQQSAAKHRRESRANAHFACYGDFSVHAFDLCLGHEQSDAFGLHSKFLNCSIDHSMKVIS